VASPLGQDNINGVVIAHTDLSRIKQAEERFRKFFESNSSVMLLVEPVMGAIIDANQAASKYYGYPAETLIGMPITQINTLPDEEVAAERLRAIRDERNYFNFRHRLASGEERDVEVYSTPIEVGGQPLLFSIVHDITRRKLAEQELSATEKRLSAIFESSPDALLIVGSDGRIDLANQQAKNLLGYTVDELVGRSVEDLVPTHCRGGHPGQRAKFIETGGARLMGQVRPIKALRKNGSECDVEVSLSQFQTDRGIFVASALRDISERIRANEKINKLAFFDQLTGLPNRDLLLDRLRLAITASSRSGTHGALLSVDLDSFKTLNDTLGHDKGDLLLKQVSERLISCVREDDTVARLGGDEFQLMLVHLSLIEKDAASQVEAVGEKVLSALRRPYLINDAPYHCTASIGATLFRGQVTVEDLMKQADLALHRAKGAGRAVLRFFDPDMEKAVMARASMETELREALLHNQFLLHYQPQVIAGGRITGAEVLIRWSHPERGMVSPAQFIPLAEETGLILPLGNWVLETACKQLAEWATRPEMADLTIAVNVSAHQFRQPDFVAQVLNTINNTGANAKRLKLELTESLLVENVQDIIGKMHALKAHGVGFSLDDFGTGYSSLSYLKRLPLDQLKIDQSFVRDVLTDPNDAAIAKTVVALANSLGLGVIAEGVETEAQRDFLAGSGCHAYQGYFFSRPLPSASFDEFVRKANLDPVVSH